MRRLARALLRNRALYSGAFVLLLVVGIGSLPRLQFDFSLEPILEANETKRQEVLEFQERVPPRFISVILTATWPRPIELPELAALGDAVEAIEQLADVTFARSIANLPVIPVDARLPVPVPFPTLVGEEHVLTVANQHPLIANNFISRDGHSAAILISFETGTERNASEEQLRDVEQVARAGLPEEVRIRRVGGAVVERAMSTSMWRDMLHNLALEIVICTLLLVLMFRTVRGALIPIGVVLGAVILSLAALALLGYRISLIDLAIPGLVTVIGLCDAVHLMNRFEESFSRGRSQARAIVDMLETVGAACFYTSFTTAIGFVSLLIADHAAVREFGVKASLAVAMTFVAVLIGIPLALASRRLVPLPKRPERHRRWLFRYGRPRLTFIMASATFIVALVGATRIVVDSRWLEELPEDSPAVLDLRWFEEHFAGVLTFDVRVAGELDDVAAFRAVERLERALRTIPDLVSVESYATWVREVMGNPRSLSDADVASGIARLRLAGPLFPTHVIDPEFEVGRITFRTPDIGTKRFIELIEEVERSVEELPSDVDFTVAGYMRMAHESSRLVVTTMLKSFCASLLAISLFIGFTFRSVRVGLISVLPNLFPIVVALGLNGWLAIPIRIGIVMIYSLGLGLAVDDTLHLLSRFFQERRSRPDATVNECMNRALQGTGRALVITSVILSAGCCCYLRSDFRSMIDLGILLNAVVITALIVDLFVFPHLVEFVFRSNVSSRDSSK